MGKVIAIVAAIIVILAAGTLLYAATRPDTFRVQRQARIEAPPETIFPLIADFHNWGSWSPYENLDPDMKRTLSGAASGEGAIYEWDSSGKAGQGRMEITDTSPPAAVAIRLDFVKPFATSNMVLFTLEPAGAATDVTWAMQGPSPYVAKVMGVFFSMDKLIGSDFEAGLAKLKALAER